MHWKGISIVHQSMLYKFTGNIIQESIGNVSLKLVEYGKFMLVYKNVNKKT